MTPSTWRASHPDADSWPVLPGIDMAAAQQTCGSNVELFKQLLVLLQKHYDNWSEVWLGATHDSTAEGNAQLCASLHKLRGGASTLGALHLARVAEQAESSLRDNQEHACVAVQRVGAVLDELLEQARVWPRHTQAGGG